MNGNWWLVRGASLAGLALLVPFAGCGTDVSEMASSVRDAATQGLEKAKETAGDVSRSVSDTVQGAAGSLSETAGLAGSFNLTVGEPLQTGGCYATCIALGPNRPAILQLQSYRDVESESYPSVFLRASVAAPDLNSLVGQTVDAQLFVKRSLNEPTLYTRDAPVQLTIRAIEEGLLVGEIAGGSLSNHGSAAPTAVSGNFRSLIQ
ncbi:MAG: hypothetical protein KJ000_03630 [Pirellulaceae bacterium]|nr:hypothetical protein [Pirellulaceae bacterium]